MDVLSLYLNKMSKKAILIGFILIMISGLVIISFLFDWGRSGRESALDFADCVQSGFYTTQKVPRECKDGYGKVFIEDLGNVLDKSDLIKLANPLPNSSNTSPLTITGQARGYWFFEGSFLIKIKDLEGKVIGQSIAKAKTEWMTEDFVDYESTMYFNISTTTRAILELNKDNPSGLEKYADRLFVPIVLIPGKTTPVIIATTSTSTIIKTN